MAKKAILDVLESTIGKYVHNLDAQSLNVAVWSGKIQLHNLELNTEAVNAKLAQNAQFAPNLAIPFRVVGGMFEQFQVDVPWAKLTSKPVVLSAKGLTILLEPFDHLAPSPLFQSPINATTNGKSSTKRSARKNKLSRRAQAMLEANEGRLQYNAVRRLAGTNSGTVEDDEAAALWAEESSSSGVKMSDSFLQRLIRRIIENLQLQVQSVNIEVRGSNGSSVGLILQNLSLVSTDDQGNPAFVARKIPSPNSTAAEFLYKALHIAGFGLYCDEPHQNKLHHSYIVSPLSFKATLRQSDAMRCIEFPKYLVSSNLSNCSILMTKQQLELISQIIGTLKSAKGLRSLYPEYRPDVPISRASAKLWWIYAVKSVLRITRRRSCWVDFLQAFQKRKIYISLYKRHMYKATCSWLNKPLTHDEIKALTDIENDNSISVEGIMAWRNMADAQVELERKKRNSLAQKNQSANSRIGSPAGVRPSNRRVSLMGSIFGSTKAGNYNNSINTDLGLDKDNTNQYNLDDEPPFTLTPEEMKELEAINLEQTSDMMVSVDSKLCDLKFGLASFKVDLILPHSQLVSLTMGAVTSSFAANADGSYAFDFSLSSLQIDDKITVGSMFPSVARTMSVAPATKQNHSSSSINPTVMASSRQAFQIMLDRARHGDSHLVVRGAAIELVASPVFVVGISNFFNVSPSLTTNKNIGQIGESHSLELSLLPTNNPYLQESVSGNIDLFFDTNEGKSYHFTSTSSLPLSHSVSTILDENPNKGATLVRISDNISKALAEAWKNKKRTQRKWTVDIEIYAPIIIVPENCTDPQATVLVLDFGRLAVKSRKTPSKKVANWFRSHTVHRSGSDILDEVESWKIETSNLTFLVGTACDQDWGPTAGIMSPEHMKSEAIIEPFSMIFNIGMDTLALQLPRMCIDGVLPALTIVVCFAHFQKILGVASAWSLVLAQIKSDYVAANGTDGEGLQIIEEERSTFQVIKYSGSGAFGSTKEPTMLDSVSKKEREGISTVSDTQHEFFEHIHASIALRRLSAKLFTGSLKGTDRLEAHLVSVVLTTSMSTDGSSLSRLCGGWFWILDLMPASFPRRQRLIAHSSLPMQSETFSYSEKYEMMEELERQGVFQDGYEGSSELADIEIRISPNSLNVSKCTGPSRDLIIHARFSSLFINWNPYVIKALILTKQYMLESTLSSIKRNPEAFNVLLSTLHLSEKPSTTPHRGQSKNTIMSHKPNHSMVRLDARMDKFVISFHSAKDDLQLYILTMSGAKIDVSILPNSDSVTAFLEVGDFRMETPQLGRTLPLYRTLMGLAPNQSTCLLSVKYFQGIPAVASSGIIGADATVHESCAQISVSPMRFVHIQAQIVTLVDYIQDGVIGAVLGTTSPAVAPATVPKVTQAVTGEKLFLVHATSFEFVVPHAAYIKDYFSFHALELDVRYRSLANFGGGEAEVVLSEMSCACSRGISMLKEPVKISLHASIAPNHAPTEEDRAIKVSMDLSEACLFLTHNQFEQLLYMTKRNMTEENNFLRDQPAGSQDIKNEGNNSSLGRNTTKSGSTWDSNTLNHAGVQALIIKKRILIKTKVQVLALVLCRHSADEPFLEIAGVKSDINLNLLPDQSKIQLVFILHNLNVEDKRIETEHRYYRQVFSHLKIREGTKDVFNLKYLKDEANGLANIDVCVGDLQLIVIPDCMYELMDFMQISDVVSLDIERSLGENKCLDTITNVAIDINDSNEEIEAMVEKRPSEPKTVQTSLSIQTSTCRIVMVNMESSSTETLVAQGKVDIQISSKKLLISGLILSNETQVNGESLEIYTSQLDDIGSSVQIMEPASFSVSVSKTYSPGIGTQDLVIKAAALSSVDISFSMKNAGLLQDVIKSIKESLIFAQQMQEQRSLSDKAYSPDPKPLTDVEFDRIENLAFALEHVEGVKSTLIKDSFGNYSDSSRASDSFSELTGIKDDCSQERILHYYRINVTVPDVSFTLINDLQGLDAPLLKLSARNMVGSGQSEMLSNSSQFVNGVKAYGAFEWSSVKFRVRINANIAAEYFDVISNNWEKLLLKPWESTLTLQRGETHRFKRAVKRMATDVDIESQTCLVSFSEQFLVSVGTALRMWSFEHYTRKMLVEETFDLKQNMKDERICMSPSVPSPYCIDNQIGIPVYYVVQPCGTTTGNLDKRQRCDSGSLQYFRFQYPPAKGVGGRRLYGQEGSEFKGLDLYIGDSVLRFPHIDTEINNLRRAHVFSDSLMIFIDVVNGGRATVIRLRSRIHLYNYSSLDFAWGVQNKEGIFDIGICPGCRIDRSQPSFSVNLNHDLDQKVPSLGVPVPTLKNFVSSDSPAHADSGLTLLISPFHNKQIPSAVTSFYDGNSADKWGAIALPPPYALAQMANGDGPISTMDIICAAVKSDETKSSDENIMVVQVCVKVSLVDNVHPFVEIFVRPRALLQNKLPITMMVRTSAEFTFAAPDVSKEDYFKDEAEKRTITTHSLKPNAAIEIYSQDSSIPISIRCGDAPVSGTETDWCKGWIDVPLGRSRLASPVHCLLPFKKGKGQSSGGIEFLICEDEDVVSFQSFSDPTSSQSRSQSVRFPLIRTVNFALSNFAVDHTGAMLFELETVKGNRSGFCPFPAFSCPRVHRRITLLPTSDIVKLRMVKLSIQAHEGFKRSIPFCVDDISICEGGIQSSAIYWENNKPSGFFAYRRPSIGNQWEVHFVPEFVLFNGGKHTIIVQKMNAFHVKIKPHKMSHFYGAQLEGLIVSVIIPDVHGETKGIQVDSLGTRIRVVRSIDNGRPIGSLAVQTVVGAQDSRLVIKVGEVRFGGLRKTEFEKGGSSIIANDFLRLRIRWSLLEVTLHDTERLMFSSPLDTESSTAPRKIDKVRAASIGRICSKRMESHVSSREFDVRGDKALISSRSLRKCKPVAQVKFFQVTIDFQRIFKDRDMNDSSSLTNDERSQFSIIVHQAVLLDCTSEEEQVVFESASSASFIDLCLRFKGSLNADLIKVDLLSLNLAHFNGKSESIVISTSESFVWRLVDVAYRIVVTISELTGVHSKHGISEHIIPKGETEEPASSNTSENDAVYTPPQSDKLFDVKVAVVSPVKLIVSFKRQPHSSRYQLIKDVKFARLVNYFVSKLNFTVDQASISFSGYRTSDVKGPPSRLLEELRAVYVSRLKYQLITLITSVSIQEWKTLTARTEGAESYVEGDVLRMTGHIIGRSAGYMFKKFGEGIGDSLTAVTGSLGENVEKSASLIGLGVVGGAVNSVVSGLGDGVSSTVKGVGSGASKVVKGAGKGVGQIAGGVEGGVTLFAKGIKKGICHGDGDAVVSGFSDGAASMISGVGQGLESAFVGATEGVVNVGQGLFHGIGSVGMGIGNALMGKPSKKVSSKKDIRRR